MDNSRKERDNNAIGLDILVGVLLAAIASTASANARLLSSPEINKVATVNGRLSVSSDNGLNYDTTARYKLSLLCCNHVVKTYMVQATVIHVQMWR